MSSALCKLYVMVRSLTSRGVSEQDGDRSADHYRTEPRCALADVAQRRAGRCRVPVGRSIGPARRRLPRVGNVDLDEGSAKVGLALALTAVVALGLGAGGGYEYGHKAAATKTVPIANACADALSTYKTYSADYAIDSAHPVYPSYLNPQATTQRTAERDTQLMDALIDEYPNCFPPAYRAAAKANDDSHP